jgi:hypothetical protein
MDLPDGSDAIRVQGRRTTRTSPANGTGRWVNVTGFEGSYVQGKTKRGGFHLYLKKYGKKKPAEIGWE